MAVGSNEFLRTLAAPQKAWAIGDRTIIYDNIDTMKITALFCSILVAGASAFGEFNKVFNKVVGCGCRSNFLNTYSAD